MSKLTDTRDKLQAKRKELAAIFDQYPDLDMPADVASDIKARNDELTDLGKQFDALQAADQARTANAKALEDARTPVNALETPRHDQRQPETKRLRQILDESKAYQAFRAGQVKTATFEVPDDTAALDLGFKTLITSSDWVLPPQRLPQLI
jgi:hypothetical protein